MKSKKHRAGRKRSLVTMLGVFSKVSYDLCFDGIVFDLDIDIDIVLCTQIYMSSPASPLESHTLSRVFLGMSTVPCSSTAVFYGVLLVLVIYLDLFFVFCFVLFCLGFWVEDMS
jgi:ABC-type uncharacterized transport system permease subunit